MDILNKIRWGKRWETAVQNQPPIHPFTLSFKKKKLNKAFDTYTTRGSLGYVRTSLVLAIFLYVNFSWLDRMITPELVSELMVIRVISCLIFATVIYLTFTRWGINNFQFLMSMVVLLAALGIISMIHISAGFGIIGMFVVSETIGGYHYYAGLILAVMYAHGLLRLRFIYATLTTWLIIVIYILSAILLGNTPFQIYINNFFFLVSANILGMFASYWLEYYMKAVFWNERILNEKNNELQAEHDRKSSELEAARKMQLNMLPQRSPYLPDYQFSFSMKAASEVGGDYYDFQFSQDGQLTFGIGDATGHGLQASVMVTAIKLLFSEHAGKGDIVEFLKRASRSISLMGFRKFYMAFAVGRLYDHKMELAGAGMPPALIYRSVTKTVEQIPLKGLPLGSQTSYPYQKTTVSVDPGDMVLFMTDGLPELFNRKGDMIGYQRIVEIFAKVGHTDPDHIINHLHMISETWLDGEIANDDMTFFILKRKQRITSASTPNQAILGNGSAENVEQKEAESLLSR